jgi:mannose-6-phosphate isomerase-like protein (cupin superfamily)
MAGSREVRAGPLGAGEMTAMTTADGDNAPIIFDCGTQPDDLNGKSRKGLGAGGMVTASVQYIAEGGDNNLHAHSAEDEVFLVLGGRVRFYGRGDVVVAELGEKEGIIIPRGFPYWFESASEEVLSIYKVGAQDPYIKNERLNFEGLTAAQVARGDEFPLTGRVPTADERK